MNCSHKVNNKWNILNEMKPFAMQRHRHKHRHIHAVGNPHKLLYSMDILNVNVVHVNVENEKLSTKMKKGRQTTNWIIIR